MPDQIFVKLFDGKNVPIDLPKGLSTKISEIKESIRLRIGVESFSCFDLLYVGAELIDNASLSEMHIQNESTLTLIRNVTGGGGYSFPFPDIGKVKEKEFAKAPDFRRVIPGLNFLADCDTCKEYVAIQIGYNKEENDFFDIGSMGILLKCSNSKCKAEIGPEGLKNLVLYQSVWKYECLFKNEKKPKSKMSYNPDDSKYITLDDAEESKQDYRYLYLRVIKKEYSIKKVEGHDIYFVSPDDNFNQKIYHLDQFNFKADASKKISKL